MNQPITYIFIDEQMYEMFINIDTDTTFISEPDSDVPLYTIESHGVVNDANGVYIGRMQLTTNDCWNFITKDAQLTVETNNTDLIKAEATVYKFIIQNAKWLLK